MPAASTKAKPGQKGNPADADPKKTAREQIREEFQGGKPRGVIAQERGMKYQQVYAYTKDLEGPEGAAPGRARVMVEWPKGSGQQKSRVEVIRELFGTPHPEGGEWTVGKISRELGTSYQIVYQATRDQRDGATSGEATTAEEGEEDVEVEEADFEEDEDEDEEDES